MCIKTLFYSDCVHMVVCSLYYDSPLEIIKEISIHHIAYRKFLLKVLQASSEEMCAFH